MKAITIMAILLFSTPAWAWVWMDAGGQYACSDSLHPVDVNSPEHAWESIAETGEELPLAGSPQYVPVGFSFEFYGEVYEDVGVAPWPLAVFDHSGFPLGPTPVGIPGIREPDGFVAPFWMRTEVYDGLRIFVETQGEPGNQRLIVEWRDGLPYLESGPSLDVQLVLEERTGAIFFHYLSGGEAAALVTVGLENQTGTDGIEVYHGPANEYNLDGQTVVCVPLYDGDGDGYTRFDGDCDDDEPEANPGERESCDGLDNNCDGEVDEGFDRDGDGFSSCGGDCNDREADIHPGAEDFCDGFDNDCDAATADGAGDAAVGVACDGEDTDLCAEGATRCAAGELRCDEAAGDATDVCDGADNDCNPETPDGLADPRSGWSCDGEDADLCAGGTLTCEGGELVCAGDVEVVEECNGRDDDCDGVVPEAERDADGDGFGSCAGDCDDREVTSHPGATEGCDGFDNDCDGEVDEDDVCGVPDADTGGDADADADTEDDGGEVEVDGDVEIEPADSAPDTEDPEVEDADPEETTPPMQRAVQGCATVGAGAHQSFLAFVLIWF